MLQNLLLYAFKSFYTIRKALYYSSFSLLVTKLCDLLYRLSQQRRKHLPAAYYLTETKSFITNCNSITDPSIHFKEYTGHTHK